MLTNPQVLIAAVTHAKQRWCWDDVAAIEELVTGLDFPNEEAVREYIDQMAEHYDLIDPRTVGL